MSDTRGRLTLPDVAFITMSIAVFGALAPVLYTIINDNASELTTGQAYLIQIVVPLTVIVIMGVVYRVATAGVVR